MRVTADRYQAPISAPLPGHQIDGPATKNNRACSDDQNRPVFMKPGAETAVTADRQAVMESRGRLRSAFGRRGGSVRRASCRSSSGGAATAGAASRATGGGTAGRSGTAGTLSTATNASRTAATDALTAAAGFSVGTQTHQNRDRSSSRKTKHTIHPDLPQFQNTEPKTRPPTSVCLPPAAAIPRGCA